MIRLLASFLIIICSTSCVEKSAQFEVKKISKSNYSSAHEPKITHAPTNQLQTQKVTSSNQIQKSKVIPIIHCEEIESEVIVTEDVACGPYVKQNENRDSSVYIFVDEQAEFPGGYQEMAKFIAKNLRYLADNYGDVCVEGKVYLRFIVRKDGSVTNIRVTRGIDGFSSYDKEALKVIQKMPLWKPAKVKDELVDSYFDLPIKFGL